MAPQLVTPKVVQMAEMTLSTRLSRVFQCSFVIRFLMLMNNVDGSRCRMLESGALSPSDGAKVGKGFGAKEVSVGLRCFNAAFRRLSVFAARLRTETSHQINNKQYSVNNVHGSPSHRTMRATCAGVKVRCVLR